MRLAFIVLLVTVASAHAEPEPPDFTFSVGAGVAWSHLETPFRDDGFTAGPSLRFDLGYRIKPHLAIGAHFGVARGQSLQYESFESGEEPCPPYLYEFDYTSVEFGVMAQLVFDRFWLAPWIGTSELLGETGDLDSRGNTSLGYGVAAGYGFYALPSGHYVDVVASAARSLKDDSTDLGPPVPFVAFSFGIAYRY